MDEKKKRGRKPKTLEDTTKKTTRKTKAVFQAWNSSGNQISDDENIVVHLNIPIDANIINSEQNTIYPEDNNQPNQPFAYNHDNWKDYSLDVTLESVEDSTACTEEYIIVNPEIDNTTNLKIVKLLKEFEEKNKNKEWPSNTSIACYWCCHKFDNAPIGIPISYQDNQFDVFGCFCSLNCACAFNYDNSCYDELWERQNLLNLLSRKLDMKNIVKPAPTRLSLKLFGGYMDITEFRSFNKCNKLVNINFPPMNSLSQQIEEINEFEVNNDFRYIPIDNDRINKIKEKMIKRSKPITNKNSLENTMNLKYT